MWVREMEKYVYELERRVLKIIKKNCRVGAKNKPNRSQTWTLTEGNGCVTQIILDFVPESQLCWFHASWSE